MARLTIVLLLAMLAVCLSEAAVAGRERPGKPKGEVEGGRLKKCLLERKKLLKHIHLLKKKIRRMGKEQDEEKRPGREPQKPFTSLIKENPRMMTSLVNRNSDFALEMYKELRNSDKSHNVFFSPLSVSMAMAMTMMGAEGNTKEEMMRALKHHGIEDEAFHQAMGTLHASLNDPKASYQLALANRIFARQGREFREEFMSGTKKVYRAMAQILDFARDPEGSRHVINQWVEGQTNEKIKDLIPEGGIDNMAAMVLVNAIYFKGKWQIPFKPERTRKMTFHVTHQEKKEADFMSLNEDLKIVNANGAKLVALPYEGKDLSMYIMLPNERHGLADLEDKMDLTMINGMIAKMREIKVMLRLPKFKVEYEQSLKKPLQDMGMKDLFERGQADLSGMDGTRELFVSKVFHKAFIEVNEEGTEAAGATGVGIMLMSMPETMDFRADHPFIYFIRDNQSGSILFMGRMDRP